MLSRGDTGDRLAEVDEVLGCLVVQTVEHHIKSELKRDPLWYIERVQCVRVATSRGRTCVYH